MGWEDGCDQAAGVEDDVLHPEGGGAGASGWSLSGWSLAEEEEEEEEEEARAERRARATCLHAIVLRLVRRGTTDDILPVGIETADIEMCGLDVDLELPFVFFRCFPAGGGAHRVTAKAVARA